MEPITILDDEDMSLWYHPDTKIVHHKIKRFLRPGGLRKLLEAVADGLEKHGATKWLGDDRLNPVSPAEDVDWASNVWDSRAREAGLKYWAIVVPSTAVAAMQVQNLQELHGARGLTVKGFETVEDAQAWLESIG